MSLFVPVIRPFGVQDFNAIESLYRQQKTALLRERIRRAVGRWLARPLLTALYVTFAILLSTYGVQLAFHPSLSVRASLGVAVALHVVFLSGIGLFVRLRHRRDVDVAVKLDLGLRLQRYATASSSWHLLLVALHEQRVIGWIGATFSPVHNAAVIDTLGVDVEFRRRGVARQLLVAAERSATLRQVRRFDVVLRAPHNATLASTLLLCAADDLAPDANIGGAPTSAGDDIVCDRPAAMLFHRNGFRPVKRLEQSTNQKETTVNFTDSFELWRKSLITEEAAEGKLHNE
jgi:GNAT superfamily N-acetyltransferase